jgi:hypothetical protein
MDSLDSLNQIEIRGKFAWLKQTEPLGSLLRGVDILAPNRVDLTEKHNVLHASNAFPKQGAAGSGKIMDYTNPVF